MAPRSASFVVSFCGFRPNPVAVVLLGLGLWACGDDAGDGGATGGTLGERSRSARLARERARCACEPGSYETIEACAERAAFGVEYNACDVNAWSDAGLAAEAVECYVEAGEAEAGCFAAIDGCDAAAVQACDDAVDAARAACDPAFAEPPPDAYFASLDACVASNVVGEATGCAPGTARDAVGAAAFSGSAIGAGDDVQASCETSSSADVEIAWTAPATGRYRFTTDGTVADAAFLVLDSCGGTELACDAWREGGPPNRQSVVELDVTGGETYVLVVDFLFDSSVGDYVVNIAPL